MKGDEEQKACDKDRRIVGDGYDQGHKKHVADSDPKGHRFFSAFRNVRSINGSSFFPEIHMDELFPEIGPIQEIGEDNSKSCFPAESEEHIGHRPVPGVGEDNDCGGGEVGEDPADRNIDKEESDRRIGQSVTRMVFIELAR